MPYLKIYPSIVLPLLLITTLASMRGNTILSEARNLLDIPFPELPTPELPDLPKIDIPDFPNYIPTLPELEVPEIPDLPKLTFPTMPSLTPTEIP